MTTEADGQTILKVVEPLAESALSMMAFSGNRIAADLAKDIHTEKGQSFGAVLTQPVSSHFAYRTEPGLSL
jgi:hypothetical protein